MGVFSASITMGHWVSITPGVSLVHPDVAKAFGI
jgi:hypothetical protein